jgi:hypothetical protein
VYAAFVSRPSRVGGTGFVGRAASRSFQAAGKLLNDINPS